MFRGCRLGLKEHDPDRIGQHVRLVPEDVDGFISRTPADWALGKPWDDDDLGNREIGNCGPAALVNWYKLMSLAAGRPDLAARFTTEDAKAFYRACGWDGTDVGDEGVVLLDMMCEAMRTPIQGVKLDGFFAIGFADDAHLATAVTLAPLIVGESLTQDCKTTDRWTEETAQGRLWGGHAVLYVSDSPGGGNCKTWGRPVFQDQGFRFARWNEAYLPICFELMPHIDGELLAKIGSLL